MSSTGNGLSIYEAWKSGKPMPMEWFINQGAIKTSTITYCNIYDTYKRHREDGKNYMQAVEVTAEEMNTSPDTVKRAVAAVL